MDENTHVYCTECANFDLSDSDCPECEFEDKCYFWNWEDSTPFSMRPKYESKMQ